MRPYITNGFALLILVGGIFGFIALTNMDKKEKPQAIVMVPTAFIQEAKNESVPVSIVESGRLSARYKIDLFAEVQGVMETPAVEFKPGAQYKKGTVLLKIKSDDYYANLQAQKSVFQSLITGILPDLKLDYPDAYKRWDAYLKAFDMAKPVADLPEPKSDKEKFFLTGKNIYTTYYNTKNLEIVLSKYTLRAPFDGVLTEALVTPGTLVRNGQRLGEFIDPSEYELELAIGKALMPAVKVGKAVAVKNPENDAQTWEGIVTRINGKMDPNTQTVQVYVAIKGDALKEGMYLEARVAGEEKVNAIGLHRNLLVDGDNIYVVGADSILALEAVQVLHKTREEVIVQGIEEGTLILDKAIPGAYVGMKVNLNAQN